MMQPTKHNYILSQTSATQNRIIIIKNPIKPSKNGTRVSQKMLQNSPKSPAKRVKIRVKRALHVASKEYKNKIFYYIKWKFILVICVYSQQHWHLIINDI